MLAAGDTFRAAAVEQLQVWGERNNVPVIAQLLAQTVLLLSMMRLKRQKHVVWML